MKRYSRANQQTYPPAPVVTGRSRGLRIAAAVCLALGSLPLAYATADRKGASDTGHAASPPLILAQIPADGPDDPPGHDGALPEGSRIVTYDPSRPADGVTVLTDGFVAAGRPDLSFDARRVLFVGRRHTNDPLSVWEMDLNGKDVRRITDVGADCDSAIYLTTTFTLDAERPVDLIAFRAATAGGTRALYTCHLDGSRVTRITFTPYDVSPPYLLSDSRLLFGIQTPTESDSRPASLSTRLFTINTDGTDVFPFAAVHGDSAQRSTPCETTDEWIVFVESHLSGGDPGGSLVAVPRTRSLRIRRVWADDPAGIYYSPAAMPEGRLLSSYRTHDGNYGLHLLDRTSGKRVVTVFDDPDFHDIHARPILPRREPHGHSSVVDDAATTGKLYCLNTYLSQHETVQRLAPDGIQKVRVIQAERGDRASDRAAAISERVLGEASVAEDGSFFLEVPARTPLRLELLSEGGGVLQSMQSWIWVMPKERRGCIGCHEDRELTPPNRHVYALWKKPQRIGIPKKPRTPPSQIDGAKEHAP